MNSGWTAGPKVLVLGATGFLGQALVKRLLLDGRPVRAMVRNTRGLAQRLVQPGVELVPGDLLDSAAVESALDGIGHVYHLARGTGPSWDDYLRTDVEATRRLALRCAARGISLVYTSSIAIYDGALAGDVITEATPPSPAAQRLNSYARAKVANEHLLAELHRERSLQVLVFRPGIVIGAGGPARHPGVGAWPQPSTCRPWGGGGHNLPFVLVDDCVDAMVRARGVPGLAGQSFNLIGDAKLSGMAYLDALELCMGSPIQRAPWPAWRLFAQSGVKWGLRRLQGRAENPLPSYRYVDSLSCRARYAADAAKQHLAWAPVADTAVLIERGVRAAWAAASA